VLGLDSTTQIGMAEMIHHTKAVRRGVKQALVVGDMPFEAYQKDPKKAVANANRFMTAGCDAVKVEWFSKASQVTADIIKAGIPVMGHVGLTPQTAEKLGGMKVQGKDADSAVKILENAIEFQKRGCFSIVLECIPDKLAGAITKSLKIPTIGIGAGVQCDGQVLVINDMLGLFDRYLPKFVKRYANLQDEIKKAVGGYIKEVGSKKFPSAEYTFTMKDDEWDKLKDLLKVKKIK
jgi:3-methyl-2-oxobutanoate hydroxymethyltransferase